MIKEVVAVKVSEAAFQQMYSGRSLEKHALYISFRDRKAVIERPQRHVMELLLRSMSIDSVAKAKDKAKPYTIGFA
ncbi:unnamed protein product, partial [Vitis vinifera]|uniref:Uncharacterized protein n=1 Tax=Vitis vinifera TaxID=29760 RepID=D7U2K5_VITVI